MMNLIDFTGKTLMITGASSGIGQASAILAAELGASVVLCGRDEDKLYASKKMLKNQNRHFILNFDVTDFENYNSYFDKIISSVGKLNGLIHCAGIADVTPLRAISYSKLRNIIDTNFSSFIMLIACFSKKKYSDGGSIVGISSANTHYPQKYMSVYAASKAALEASVKTMSLELYEKNIRINCIAPGAVDTPMAENLDDNTLNQIISRHLMGISTPESIAKVILFLMSNAAETITGRTIFADGGLLGQ